MYVYTFGPTVTIFLPTNTRAWAQLQALQESKCVLEGQELEKLTSVLLRNFAI